MGTLPLLLAVLAVVAVWLLPLGPRTPPTIRAGAPAASVRAEPASVSVSGDVAPAAGATTPVTASTFVTCAPRLRAATTAGVETTTARQPATVDLGHRRAAPERSQDSQSQLLGRDCSNRGPPSESPPR